MTDLKRIAREARLGRQNLRRARAALAADETDMDTAWQETDVLFRRLRRIQRLATVDSTPRGRGMIRT